METSFWKTSSNAAASAALHRRPQSLWIIYVWLAFVLTASSQAAERKLAADWSVWIGVISDSSPALGTDGTIYFGAFDGRFWALNPDGSKKWIFRTNIEIKSSPAVTTDGIIYFGSRDRRMGRFFAGAGEGWDNLFRLMGQEFLRIEAGCAHVVGTPATSTLSLT